MSDTRIIDSRDLIAEMNELLALQEAGEVHEANFDADRLAQLQELANAGIEDWQDGAQLIRDDHFQDYAEDLADDLGLTGRGEKWPFTCIDWVQAAQELQYDFTPYTFDGETYWVR